LVKGKGNVRCRTGMESHRGRRGEPLIFNLGAISSPRAGLEGWGKFKPTGNRSQDRPARSELLYWLNYRGPLCRAWKIWNAVTMPYVRITYMKIEVNFDINITSFIMFFAVAVQTEQTSLDLEGPQY
jgi:hypothetical protein